MRSSILSISRIWVVISVLAYSTDIAWAQEISATEDSWKEWPFLFGFLLLIFGAMFFWSGIRHRRLVKVITRLPVTKMKSLTSGLVQIQGIIEGPADTMLVAPFTRKECVAYETYVEQSIGDGGHVTLVNDDALRPFWVTDRSGSILIDPQKMALQFEPGFSGKAEKNALPPEVERLFQEKKIQPHRRFWEFAGRIVYEEKYLLLGQEICIIGTVIAVEPKSPKIPNHALKNIIIGAGSRKSVSSIFLGSKEVVYQDLQKKIRREFTLGTLCLLGLGICVALLLMHNRPF